MGERVGPILGLHAVDCHCLEAVLKRLRLARFTANDARVVVDELRVDWLLEVGLGDVRLGEAGASLRKSGTGPEMVRHVLVRVGIEREDEVGNDTPDGS